jgi:extradiol dioxygenase family protein
LSGCIRQCDWDDYDVCRSCGTDYSPPKTETPPKKLRPFHLAFPVDDLTSAKKFYTEVLGCSIGREKEESCVFNFYGHQIVAHKVTEMPDVSVSPVDGKEIPALHFGLVMEWEDWHQLKNKLESNHTEFVIGPYTRYENQPGSQATMFVKDPSGNHLEFKSFKDDNAIFDTSW